jgi:hypothetical protein
MDSNHPVREANTHIHLVLRLRMHGVVPRLHDCLIKHRGNFKSASSDRHCERVSVVVLTTVIMNSTIFRVVMPCSSKRIRRFRVQYRLHLQSWIVIQARNQQKQAADCWDQGDNTLHSYHRESQKSNLLEKESVVVLTPACHKVPHVFSIWHLLVYIVMVRGRPARG